MSEKTPWRYFDAYLSQRIAGAQSKSKKGLPALFWIVDSDADMVATTRSERIAKMLVGLVNQNAPVWCKRCGGNGRIDERAGDSSLVGTCPVCGGAGERPPGTPAWVPNEA